MKNANANKPAARCCLRNALCLALCLVVAAKWFFIGYWLGSKTPPTCTCEDDCDC